MAFKGSKSASWKGGKNVGIECLSCKKIFRIYACENKKGNKKWCSIKCRMESIKGRWAGENNPMYKSNRSKDKNPNWKGGVTGWRKNIYNSERFKIWSLDVKKEWDFTCQICGKRGNGEIESHHIKTFNNYPELRFEKTNGIALCESCHNRINKREEDWVSYFSFCWENKLWI